MHRAPRDSRGSGSLLLLAVLAAPSVAQDPIAPPTPLEHEAPFFARQERPLPAKPEGLCAGDFNGDGSMDLAATLVSPGAVLIWKSTSQGLEHDFENYPCGNFPLPPLALPRGRFGASEKAQALAICSRATRKLEFFGATNSALTLERTPRAMAAGMLGEQALLAVACDGRRLELLREGGQQLEHWTLSGDLPRCALVSSALSAVLVGFQDSTRVEAYAARDGTSLGALELGGIPRALAEIDIDGDGDLELAIAGGDSELWIFGSGNREGAAAWLEDRAPLVWRTAAIPTAIAVADYDLDGRADLAILSDFSLSVQILSGLSPAGARNNPAYYVGQTPCGLAALDIDADGQVDIAVVNRDTQGLGLVRGDGAGALRIGTNLPLEDFPSAMAAAPEHEKQSALRLVALNVKSNTISAVTFDGSELRAHPGVACGTEGHAPRIAELDGQPGLDVMFLVAGPRGADLRLFRGDVEGRLSHASTLELNRGASDLALLDVDGDGKLEIALCDPQGALVQLLEQDAVGKGPAALASAAKLEVPLLPRALSLIELDGDRSPELACVLGAPGSRVGVAWLEAKRNATGTLELSELGFTPLPDAPLEAVACDLNGDGRADLAVLATRASDSGVGEWFALIRAAQGAAEFSASAPISTGMLPRGITAADVDGDGRAEVFVSVQNSTLVEVWTALPATGDQPFRARALDSLGAGRGPLDVCMSDVDGDGTLDLCIANAFANDLGVLFGVGK